jgi:two-component system chemotaxis sensor kinase CheA
MDEIVKEFLIECNELLDQMDRDLVGLEKAPGSKDLLAQVFRAIHTIKGTSGTLGFPLLERLSHSGESLLSCLRAGTLRLNREMATALLSSMDVARKLLGSIELTERESEEDISKVVEELNRFLVDAVPVPQPVVSVGVTQDSYSSAQVIEPLVVESSATSDPAAIDIRSDLPNGENADSPSPVANQNTSLQISGSTIRVDVHLLDKLMDLVGELVLSRNQLIQMTSRINDAHFLRTAQRLKLLTSEIQESITKTRMQPIETVWKKLPRLVRDVSTNCNKRVRIQMEGSETELDKTLLEAINDPLLHIVRNAVDHGLEVPAIRKRLGKPEEGLILLRAFHEGGQVNIEISDDGQGIALDRVKQKALKDGTITAAHAVNMSDQDALNLVFLPGLSTAKQVTNLSGRGVGMDIVKTNIENIGGTVDLRSENGKGTKLTIKIPLTLAIIPALIVASGGEQFAIPQVSLLELVRLEEDAARRSIERIHGHPVFRLRGNLLPLVELNQELELQPKSIDGSSSIVVLQTDGRQFGLVVDQIYDTEEIVVKPLSSQIKGIHCFSGATILGDGHVALILDVWGLAKKVGFGTDEKEHKRSLTSAARQTDLEAGQSWLLFRIGEQGRMALPLSTVARLENLDIRRVEHSGKQEVFQYRGQIMPLLRITEFLNRKSTDVNPEVLQVVVYPRGARNVGLIVDEILDIVQGHSLLDETHTQLGIAGCAVIQDRVTDLLDVETVMRNLDAAPSASEEVFA